LGAAVALLLKFALVACAVVVVETAQSRLRFYRYQEPLAASFVLAVLAIVGTQLS
jgi:formate hydrogenlyase subunit 4